MLQFDSESNLQARYYTDIIQDKRIKQANAGTVSCGAAKETVITRLEKYDDTNEF